MIFFYCSIVGVGCDTRHWWRLESTWVPSLRGSSALLLLLLSLWWTLLSRNNGTLQHVSCSCCHLLLVLIIEPLESFFSFRHESFLSIPSLYIIRIVWVELLIVITTTISPWRIGMTRRSRKVVTLMYSTRRSCRPLRQDVAGINAGR